MGSVVLNVRGIDQCNQNIDIKQEPGHGSSSRSWRTNSEVTRGVPLRTLRSGTPFRVLSLDSAGESACLANEEITSPTVFFSIVAISLAALNTSSSITRVVRMIVPQLCIMHQMQTSYIGCTWKTTSFNSLCLPCDVDGAEFPSTERASRPKVLVIGNAGNPVAHLVHAAAAGTHVVIGPTQGMRAMRTGSGGRNWAERQQLSRKLRLSARTVIHRWRRMVCARRLARRERQPYSVTSSASSLVRPTFVSRSRGSLMAARISSAWKPQSRAKPMVNAPDAHACE
jgi:hypothetical protein